MENNTIHNIPTGSDAYQAGWFAGFNRLAIPVSSKPIWLEGYEDGLSEREDTR